MVYNTYCCDVPVDVHVWHWVHFLTPTSEVYNITITFPTDSEVGKAASIAAHFMDVVTTSGVGTGIAASLEKISAMREGCGQAAMSIASGITPDNAAQYAPFVDAFLVATGISPPGDFYNLDREKLRALLSACRGFNLEVPRFSLTSKTQNAETPSEKSWYLSLIKPNTAGPKFAWLDPSSIYVDSQGLSDLISDLMSQVNEEFDMVCGIDAMGFPLGAAIAEKSGKGFLTVRKAGKLCVEVDQVTYECYAGPGKVMEMRKNAFAPGTRVSPSICKGGKIFVFIGEQRVG